MAERVVTPDPEDPVCPFERAFIRRGCLPFRCAVEIGALTRDADGQEVLELAHTVDGKEHRWQALTLAGDDRLARLAPTLDFEVQTTFARHHLEAGLDG